MINPQLLVRVVDDKTSQEIVDEQKEIDAIMIKAMMGTVDGKAYYINWGQLKIKFNDSRYGYKIDGYEILEEF